MIIYFFTKGDRNVASSRQRAFLVAEELNKLGVKSIVHQPSLTLISETSWPRKIRALIQYLKIFKNIGKEDIIFLQRTIYNKYFFVLIVTYKLLFRRKMIFDFDDAIYFHSLFKTETLTRLADTVIVGSHSLADWAKRYNKNVRIIPTSVLLAVYEKFSSMNRGPNNKFVIGWVGNAVDHYENLKILVSVFQELANRQPGKFLFRLIGSLGNKKVYDLFRGISGLQVEFINSLNWADPEAVPRAIQDFDVGLMPLLDTEWNRGKCAFKAVEYMACSVPAIISPVGESKYLVNDSVNGFLPNSIKEWVDDILKLYNNQNLRIEMGHKAYEKIRELYSLEKNTEIIKSVLISL